MEIRYIVIAVLIVVGAWLLLSQRPADDVRVPVDRPRATDTIIELPEADGATPIQTVELAAPPAAGGPAGSVSAGGELVGRFEAERVNPAWAPVAQERVASWIGPVIAPRGGHIVGVECRQTTCRCRLEFEDPSQRPDAVAALMSALGAQGKLALIERVETQRVTILVVP